MKNVKRIVALMLVLIMTLPLAACGGKKTGGKGSNGGKEVEIAYWHAGLGIEWLDEMVEAFNSSQSDWNVTYRESAIKNSLTSALGMEDVDTTDLYIAGQTYDTQYMEPLEDLLDATAEGDTKTIREKMNENYLSTARAADGKVYTFSAGSSLYGVVYNKELFKKAGIDINFIPVSVADGGVFVTEKEKANLVLKDFWARSEELKNGEWKKHWHEFCLENYGYYKKAVCGYTEEDDADKMQQFSHYLDCEAHTDVWRELFPTWNLTNETDEEF